MLVVAFAGLAAEVTDHEFADFARDPTAATGAPFYFGSLSIVTSLVWWTGATAAGLAALTLRGRGDAEAVRALALGAALTGMIGLDDALQIHEELLPAAGISQKLVVAGYGVATIAVLVSTRDWIMRGPWVAIAAGAVLIAVAAGSDQLEAIIDAELHVIEDGAKLVGAALWSSFYVRAARFELTEAD